MVEYIRYMDTAKIVVDKVNTFGLKQLDWGEGARIISARVQRDSSVFENDDGKLFFAIECYTAQWAPRTLRPGLVIEVLQDSELKGGSHSSPTLYGEAIIGMQQDISSMEYAPALNFATSFSQLRLRSNQFIDILRSQKPQIEKLVDVLGVLISAHIQNLGGRMTDLEQAALHEKLMLLDELNTLAKRGLEQTDSLKKRV